MQNELSVHTKITSCSTPLFEECYKATTVAQDSSQARSSYLLLPPTSFQNVTDANNLCRAFRDSQNSNCLIQLQGECLHKYMLSKRNHPTHPIFQQQQVWTMIACISSAFQNLRRLGLSHKYTHFKEYCIRRIPDMTGHVFKIIYHEQMISQLDLARSGTMPWHSLYLSPEELALEFIPEKSIVFSLGLMLLNICAHLDSSRTVYRKDKYEISQQVIKYKLRLAIQQYGYSKLLIGFLEKCLHLDHQHRFDFLSLWDYLNKLVKERKMKNWQALFAVLDKSTFFRYSNCDKQFSLPEQKHNNPIEEQVRTLPVAFPSEPATSSQQDLSVPSITQQSRHSSQKLTILSSPINKFNSERKYSSKSSENSSAERDELEIQYVVSRHHQVEEKLISVQIIATVSDQSLENRHETADQIKRQNSSNCVLSQGAKRPIQTTGSYRYSTHMFSVPELLTELKSLKLSDCLKPIPQLIRSIGHTGVWIEGDVYYGQFDQAHRKGLGLELYSNGHYYYGYFNEDLFEGEGFYFWNPKEYYFGIFSRASKVWGRLEGQTRYQGQFRMDKRHGQGTCWYPTGQVYSGGWQEDRRHGEGFIVEPNGAKFVGNWERGKRKGEGYLESSVMRVAGNWNNEVVVGQTLIQYSNGDAFKGMTNKELQKIEGDYISSRGQVFKGKFQNNEPKIGTLTYANGEFYVGELFSMKRHGYGQYHYGNGQVCHGRWEHNQLKSEGADLSRSGVNMQY